jgi:hypothetical protein
MAFITINPELKYRIYFHLKEHDAATSKWYWQNINGGYTKVEVKWDKHREVVLVDNKSAIMFKPDDCYRLSEDVYMMIILKAREWIE